MQKTYKSILATGDAMQKVIIFFFIIFYGFFSAGSLNAQILTFTAIDQPNDDGTGIQIVWDVKGYEPEKIVLEKKEADGNFYQLAELDNLSGRFIDGENIEPNQSYTYRLNLFDLQGNLLFTRDITATASAQWFNTNKISLFVMSLILIIAIIYFIYSAKSGKELYIRKIAGLESMDESVGRATEMGKPILFVPGILDLNDMQTIAGLTILGKLAQRAAEYDTRLIVPVCRSMVLSTAKEIVKEAFLKAGRPDAYDPNSVFYLTDDQFGFVAGVDGIIIREKPAANFFLGAFYAESLILAETGFASGAIQTAGTAMPSQLPFFVVACDYTLIGEELFAASAYLSKEPHQLGSLKGQDLGKAIFVIVLTAGIIMEIFGIHFLKDFLTLH
ncbi:MAG: hypothetical protein APR54_03800 [Candidatus Cloacimonas sp. SDB]|nr:MAG: hypothetical protein APR54_03800 [Candidatus Cloacimonas sp. SDB]